MKHTLNLVALAKKADITGQCLAFIIMILAIGYTPLALFGLYVMATAQSLSSLLWTIYFSLSDCPQYNAGKYIRAAFLVVSALLLLVLAVQRDFFVLLSMGMVFAGPLMGIAYFVISLKEAGYYNKARRPYYLL